MNATKPLPSVIPDAQKRENRLKTVSTLAPSKVKLFERVFRGEGSPRQAIKAMCLECLGFNADDIRNCTAPACPLFHNRPFRKKAGAA